MPSATTTAPAAAAEAKWKRLAGVYKTFFNVAAHSLVEQWYNETATLPQRHMLKTLVKEILRFDIAAAKAHLKATYDPDISAANAVLMQHGGDLMAVDTQTKAVEWLSMAHPSRIEQFRRTFGVIKRPSSFCVLRHVDDMNPSKSYVAVETSLVPKRRLIAAEHVHPTSHMRTLAANAQAGNQSHYQQNFVWKVGSIPLAFSQRAVDRRDVNLARQREDEALIEAVHAHMHSGVTTAFVVPSHLSCTSKGKSQSPDRGGKDAGDQPHPLPCGSGLKYTPYGVLDTGNVDRTQWESVTHNVFKDTYYLQPKDTRSFQNLNDNYSRMVYLQRRKQKKLQAATAKSSPVLSSPVVRSASATLGVAASSSNRSGQVSAASVRGGAPGASVDQWLSQKSLRPVSVVFPAI